MFYICILIHIAMYAFAKGTSCSNRNKDYVCETGKSEFSEEWYDKEFQTPYHGHHNWKQSFQDMNLIVGHVQQKYSNDSNSCSIIVHYKINELNVPMYSEVVFTFGEFETNNNTYEVHSNMTQQYIENGFPVSVSIVNYLHQTEAHLDFEPISFKWDVIDVNANTTLNGSYGVIVELFGWPYQDIQKECAFLQANRYLGVEILPPVETILDFNTTVNGVLNPWHFAYQPVSYKLNSRMGNRTQLKQMINECRAKGIRIYADTVINHMAAFGLDSYKRHVDEACEEYGQIGSTGGSPWYTGGNMDEDNEITRKETGFEFPAVPYSMKHFKCISSDYYNKHWYYNRVELKTDDEYVQQRIADHLTDLISIGVSGFSFDEVTNVPPSYVAGILNKLRSNLGNKLPSDFLVYLNLILGGQFENLLCGNRDTSFGYPFYKKLKDWNEDQQKIVIWRSDFPKEFSKCNIIIEGKYLSMLGTESHFEQFQRTDRDPNIKAYVVGKKKDEHREFITKAFSNNLTKGNENYDAYMGNNYVLLLSSYSFNSDEEYRFDVGIPDGLSDCKLTKSDGCQYSISKADAYVEDSEGYDADVNGNWVNFVYTHVHRDDSTINEMKEWLKKREN